MFRALYAPPLSSGGGAGDLQLPTMAISIKIILSATYPIKVECFGTHENMKKPAFFGIGIWKLYIFRCFVL